LSDCDFLGGTGMAMSSCFPASNLDIVKYRYARRGQPMYYETRWSLAHMNGCAALHADSQPIDGRVVLPSGNMKT